MSTAYSAKVHTGECYQITLASSSCEYLVYKAHVDTKVQY